MITAFIRLTAGRLFNFGPIRVGAYSREGGGRVLFSQHFQYARTFLENNKTRDNKFISLQQDKNTVQKLTPTGRKQYIDYRFSNQVWNTRDVPLTSRWGSTEMTQMSQHNK